MKRLFKLINTRKVFNITFLLFLLIPFVYNAQERSNNKLKKTAIKFGYFGELVLHPGFYCGIDYTLTEREWFNFHWDTEVGGYVHKWNNNSVFFQSSIGTKLISSFSAYIDFNLGLGYILSSPNGDVYRFDSQAGITTKGMSNSSHLKSSFSILFGWDGKRKNNLPLTASIGFEGSIQSGFNHTVLPHAALRIGITYQLKNH
jgi:hypothetical protein